MTSVELLLDVLRMAQLAEDEIRKGDRTELERSIKEFHKGLSEHADTPLPTTTRTTKRGGGGGDGGGGGGGLRAAGWRPLAPGEWGGVRVSQLLREGGGDGSDFALALAVLTHSVGMRTRIAVVCLPASALAAVAQKQSEGDDDSGEEASANSGKMCRLVTEARVGYHPSHAAKWVGERHAAGAGSLGLPPPSLHFRRESDGATWLSLAYVSADATTSYAEQQPGGAYLPVEVADQAEAAEWVTFYPHDEHGCKWHVRGAEGDSTGRVHGSAPPRSVEAEVP